MTAKKAKQEPVIKEQEKLQKMLEAMKRVLKTPGS